MPISQSETCELVRRAAHGDDAAIEQLLHAHRGRLQQMIRQRMDPRLLARVDSSDVIQETLTEATKRLPQYLKNLPIPFYPWLRRIAWQQLVQMNQQHLDAQKRSVRREQRPAWNLSDHSNMQLANVIARGLSTPSAALSRKEICQRVRAALEQLSETDREVLLQRYVEQLSIKEIAAVLEATKEAIFKRHARALEKVHLLLEGIPDGS
jgi:RNA polymerase sigma-70 factor, ECF subfamily